MVSVYTSFSYSSLTTDRPELHNISTLCVYNITQYSSWNFHVKEFLISMKIFILIHALIHALFTKKTTPNSYDQQYENILTMKITWTTVCAHTCHMSMWLLRIINACIGRYPCTSTISHISPPLFSQLPDKTYIF